MDTLPLPPRPNLDQYRKRAKDLVSAARSRDEGALRAWAADWLGALAKSLGVTLTPFVEDSFNRAVETIEGKNGEATPAIPPRTMRPSSTSTAAWKKMIRTTRGAVAAAARGEGGNASFSPLHSPSSF